MVAVSQNISAVSKVKPYKTLVWIKARLALAATDVTYLAETCFFSRALLHWLRWYTDVFVGR